MARADLTIEVNVVEVMGALDDVVSWSLECDPHVASHMTVSEWFASMWGDEWQSERPDRAGLVDCERLYSLHVYPDSCVGFFAFWGESVLDVLKQYADAMSEHAEHPENADD